MYPPKRTSQILHWHWEGLAGPAQDSEENLHYVRKFGMCYWSLITQHIGISEPSLLYLQVAQFHLHQHQVWPFKWKVKGRWLGEMLMEVNSYYYYATASSFMCRGLQIGTITIWGGKVRDIIIWQQIEWNTGHSWWAQTFSGHISGPFPEITHYALWWMPESLTQACNLYLEAAILLNNKRSWHLLWRGHNLIVNRQNKPTAARREQRKQTAPAGGPSDRVATAVGICASGDQDHNGIP